LIQIAHPGFQKELTEAAWELGFLRRKPPVVCGI
jgi:hypothetical protein